MIRYRPNFLAVLLHRDRARVFLYLDLVAAAEAAEPEAAVADRFLARIGDGGFERDRRLLRR